MPSLSMDTVAALSSANPFPGLRPYEEADADWFFGRGAETNDLLKRLRRIHFVAIVGASGCGKSSLIRAGVLPQIRDGYLDAEWSIAAFRPGERPVANLAETLCLELGCNPGEFAESLRTGPFGLIKAIQAARVPPGGRILILVDQFEELFQFAQRNGDSAQEEVKQFLKLLLTAAASDEVPVYVVITMRLEWLNECATYVGLAEAINEGIYLVPQMSRRQFQQAILGPLDAAGGAITTALLDRMLNDLDGRSDQLPVLQHALLRIWERRAENVTFDARDYETVGTFSNCLSNHAEEVYGELNDAQKKVAEALFRSITQVYKSRKIRRPRPVAEILKATGGDLEQLEAVIGTFSRTGRSFVVTTKGGLGPESIVDVSHEALIRQWARLSAWVDNEAELQSRIARLEAEAVEWDKDRKAFKSSLYRGYQLRRAKRDLAPCLDPSSKAAMFLKASSRARLVTMGILAGSAVLIVILLAAALVNAVLNYRSGQAKSIALAEKEKEAASAEAALAKAEADRATQYQQGLVQKIEDAKGNATALAAIAQSIQAPRVYLQYVRGTSPALANKVQGELQKEGYSVPGIEQVDPGKSPAATQIRYFHAEDHKEGTKIYNIVNSLVPGNVMLAATGNPNGVVPSGQFEVWLAATATQPAPPENAPASAPVSNPAQTPAAPAAVTTPAPAVAFVASQSHIQQGQTVTLTWQTNNATDVQIEGLGAQPPSGSISLSPAQSITYKLIAQGAGGTATKSLAVEVSPLPPAPAAMPASTEVDAIEDVLKRYAIAYATESLDELKKVWPEISKDQQNKVKAVFNQFNAIRLTLDCPNAEVHIDGSLATAICRQSAVFTQKGKQQVVPTATTTFRFAKWEGAWRVTDVR